MGEPPERVSAAFIRHDGATFAALDATDVVCTDRGDMTLNGPAQHQQFMESWFTAFPDARTTIRQVQYCGEDSSLEEGVFEGTQDGVFATPQGDIPPTHRKVRCEYVSLLTI